MLPMPQKQLANDARCLQDTIRRQLGAPSAMLLPAGVRQSVEQLAQLVVVMAGHIDQLSNPPPEGLTP